MRKLVILLSVSVLLSGCGIPPSDIAIGGAVTYALYGDDLEEVTQEELQDPKTYRDAVPPQAKQGAHRVANNFRDGVRATTRRAKEWWFYDPEAEKQTGGTPVPPSYCYTVMQDIVCYPGPIPGWEHRLVGYQGTLAKAPPVVATKPLPKLAAEGDIPADTRLKSAAPVFKEIPEEVKKEREDSAQPPAGDTAQETLPDPLMSPQL